MPIIYQIDPARYFIHTRCVGDTTLEDARNHLLALQADPECPSSLNVLLDLTETTGHNSIARNSSLLATR